MEGLPYSVTTASGTYRMLKFMPQIDGYYEFYTNKTSGDPQLFVFAPQGYLMGSDDDSGGNKNAYLECYLESDVTYYIAVQGYNGSATACSVEIWILS